MDFKFEYLESDDSSDGCEVVDILYSKSQPKKKCVFGSHLSNQQSNRRAMRENGNQRPVETKKAQMQSRKQSEVGFPVRTRWPTYSPPAGYRKAGVKREPDVQIIEVNNSSNFRDRQNVQSEVELLQTSKRTNTIALNQPLSANSNRSLSGPRIEERNEGVPTFFPTPKGKARSPEAGSSKTKTYSKKGVHTIFPTPEGETRNPEAGSSETKIRSKKVHTNDESCVSGVVPKKRKIKVSESARKKTPVSKKEATRKKTPVSKKETTRKRKSQEFGTTTKCKKPRLENGQTPKRKASVVKSCKKTMGGAKGKRQDLQINPQDVGVINVLPIASTTASETLHSVRILVDDNLNGMDIKTEPQTNDDDVVVIDPLLPLSGDNVEINDPVSSAASKTNTCPLKTGTSGNRRISDSSYANLRFWKDEEVVSETAEVALPIARNVINLLNQDCTVPFIARYRSDMLGGIQVDKIREIQESFQNIKAVRKKVDSILKTLEKQDNLCEATAVTLLNAKTIPEVEHLFAPFKTGTAKTLAERAKKLGLENCAMQLMNGTISLAESNLQSFVKEKVKGVSSVTEVCSGIQHIIAALIAKDKQVLDFMKEMSKSKQIKIITKQSATAEKEDKRSHVEGRQVIDSKFELYHHFQSPIDFIKPHQVLAINRGEALKMLTVKMSIPPHIRHKILQQCWNNFFSGKVFDPETVKFLNKCVDDAYDRLLEPHLFRSIRSELTKKAQKESVSVFCSNLKNLLLTPPVRGKTVLGMDPGYKHGCKLAVVSFKGHVLATDTVFPHIKNNTSDVNKIRKLVTTHLVNTIAIGNGHGCREAEIWLSNLINEGAFSPIDINYCIINEQGVSIYSVTKECESELPSLDANHRSAVAIARRLQDPLSEYVKIDPKHLGVGMYQHDVPDSMLKTALDEVVVECVSFVGVDLNICPEVLLRKVSGLTAFKAKKIIEWREQNGSFINRKQLLNIRGLGPKAFEQCAGFVKILPKTRSISQSVFDGLLGIGNKKNKKTNIDCLEENPLDMTVIHPESYDVAIRFLSEVESSIDEIGKSSITRKIKSYMNYSNIDYIASKFGVPVERMQLIVDALLNPLEFDIRSEFQTPLFRTCITSIENLTLKSTVTGRVENVTHFGAFVDIGVGQSGLIHISKMVNKRLCLGDRVTVEVTDIDLKRKRISLRLLTKDS